MESLGDVQEMMALTYGNRAVPVASLEPIQSLESD